MDFEMSAVTMSGFVKALEGEGLLDQVIARANDAAKVALRAPRGRRWHRSVDCVEVNRALLELGRDAMERVNYRMAKDSLGGILVPAAKVAMAFGGGTPASIFSRLNNVLRITNRGLSSSWESRSPTSGSFIIEYGSVCPVEMIDAGWRGLLRVAAEVMARPLTVDRFEVLSPYRFRFELSW